MAYMVCVGSSVIWQKYEVSNSEGRTKKELRVSQISRKENGLCLTINQRGFYFSIVIFISASCM